jgi:hypothetical protein
VSNVLFALAVGRADDSRLRGLYPTQSGGGSAAALVVTGSRAFPVLAKFWEGASHQCARFVICTW